MKQTTPPPEMIRTAADKKALREGCYWDEKAGQRVVSFFEKFLIHSTGRWAGKPFKLLDWQRDGFIRPLFSWKRADGSRRFRLAYCQIAKKNGKSAICSGLALYLEMADGEAAPEVYLAASDKEQAGIVYNEAAKMVRASPSLLKKLEVIDSRKRIVYHAKNGFVRVLSSESYTAEGINIHGLIFDELHAQKNRELWDALRYGGAARTQPLIVSITTAGFDKHSICYEQYDYAKKVLGGIIEDTTFFPFICEPEPKDDWKLETTWRKANPSMKDILDLEDFRADFSEAREQPRKENSFKRYRLNMWTEQDVRWLPMEQWDACQEKFDPAELQGRVCYAGMDMSNVSDVTAFVLWFPEEKKLLPFLWVPKETAAMRERKFRVPYDTWIKEGHIRGTEGDRIDYKAIRRDIKALSKLYKIIEIGADPWNATEITTQLAEEDGFKIVEFRQGFATMNAPSKEFERLIGIKQCNAGGHPVMRWMVSNVTVMTDAAGNIKPAKDRSAEKIDGVVGAIMGIGCAMVTPVKTSVYETRGIRRLEPLTEEELQNVAASNQ